MKVSIGIGKFARKSGSSNAMDEGMIKKISNNLAVITNQKPRTHLSKKAVSNFKLREGMIIGLSVTLRGKCALDFINKLVNIALPRVRDFRGILLKSFDGNGNYSIGLKDYTVFPEVKPEDADFTHGIEITICTTAESDSAAKELLTQLGFPFQKNTSKEDMEAEVKKKALKETQAAAEKAVEEAGLAKKESEEDEVVSSKDSSEMSSSADSK